MSGSGSDEAESIARASAAAEELYRLRDTYFPRDPEEKTSKLRTLADTALALLDSLPLEMVNLATVCGGQASSVASPRPSAELRVDSREAPVELEAGQPRKKVKTCVQKKSDASAAQPEGGVIVRVGDRRRDLGWGEASPSREGAAKAPREPSIRDLCRIPAGAQGEPYQARAMGELPEGQPSDPLVARWAGLTRGDRVWADGDLAASFIRGGLHPEVARDLYTLPSEVLLGKSAKSLLWGQHYTMVLMDRVRDAGRALGILSDRNAELRRQIEEVHAGAAPKAVAVAEQRASDLEAEAMRLRAEAKASKERISGLEVEASRLKTEIKAAEEQNKELQVFLRMTRSEERLARNEAVVLSQKLEEALGEVKKASEALAAEMDQRPEKDKKLIEDYKESSGFQLGLIRSGQVTYEYGYRIALARFKARHPGLEIEEDPFVSCPEDLSVDMPDEVPFDDSAEAPKK